MRESLARRAGDIAVLAEWLEGGEPVEDDLARGLDELAAEVDAGEIKKMLGGEHDCRNAIITVHPGRRRHRVAGLGRNAPEDVSALGRTPRKLSTELMDHQPGDEAGIKSATVAVNGEYAYGLLDGRSRRASSRPHLARSTRPSAGTRRSRRCTSGPRCRTMWTSRSRTRICASTPIDPAGPAASTSTSPTPRSASPTSRPASSSRARTSDRSTRTGRLR